MVARKCLSEPCICVMRKYINEWHWQTHGWGAQVILKKMKFIINNHNLFATNNVWLINQSILWKVSLELLKFSAPTQILDMLNTLHLTIADFYLQDFINFLPVFLCCRLLLFWPSYASFSLFQTFRTFWPCVPAEEKFRQVRPSCKFLPLRHPILHFTLALPNAKQRVRHNVCWFLHLKCTSTFSVVLSLVATVLGVIFLLGEGSRMPSSIVSGREISSEVG